MTSPRSNLSLGCFSHGLIGGAFARSGALSGLGRGPFRDLVGGLFRTWSGALSGLGRGPFQDFVGGPFGTWLGCFQKHTGKEKKQQARNAKQACVHSHFVWLVLRTQEGCMPCRMKHAIRYRANNRGRSPSAVRRNRTSRTR